MTFANLYFSSTVHVVHGAASRVDASGTDPSRGADELEEVPAPELEEAPASAPPVADVPLLEALAALLVPAALLEGGRELLVAEAPESYVGKPAVLALDDMAALVAAALVVPALDIELAETLGALTFDCPLLATSPVSAAQAIKSAAGAKNATCMTQR